MWRTKLFIYLYASHPRELHTHITYPEFEKNTCRSAQIQLLKGRLHKSQSRPNTSKANEWSSCVTFDQMVSDQFEYM